MDIFGIIGMPIGIFGWIFGIIAWGKVSSLRQEFEDLKKSLEDADILKKD